MSGLEKGRTLYLTWFEDMDNPPEWRRSYSGELFLARGYFIATPDSGVGGEPFPLVVELSPLITGVARDVMKARFKDEGSVVVTPTGNKLEIRAFDEMYLLALLSET